MKFEELMTVHVWEADVTFTLRLEQISACISRGLKSIEIDQEIGSSNFTISAVTTDPKLYMQLLLDLINTGDSVVKQDKLRYSQQTIDFLTEQLRVVNDVDIKKSLINSIKQEHLEIALLTNDLPYSLKIVDKPYYSGHPISPNLQFIYIFFSFIGFSLGFIRAYLKGHF